MDTNSKTMRLIIFITGLLLSTIAYGQTSLKEIGLKTGKYKVGFKHYTISDSTRTYRCLLYTSPSPRD